MDIETLRDLGGIVPSTPVEKEITWQPRNEDGSAKGEPVTFTVRIKKLSAGVTELLWVTDEAEAKAKAEAKPNGAAAEGHSKQSELLAKSLYVGERLITYEEAFHLDPSLATEFARAVNAVNGWGSGAVKNSPPPTNSGATSS